MSGVGGRAGARYTFNRPGMVRRDDQMLALHLICKEHQVRNEEIHRFAVGMLSAGARLNQVVEYCRNSYAIANQKFWRQDRELNGLPI